MRIHEVKSQVMRPTEHDACIDSLDSTALKKLHNHHRAMSDIHATANPPNEMLHKHHKKLADAYQAIIESKGNYSGGIR